MQRDNSRIRIPNPPISTVTIRSNCLLILILAGIVSLGTIPAVSQETFIIPRDLNPAWSYDGMSILFDSNRTGDSDVWIYDFNTDSISNLTNNPTSDDHSPIWLPSNDAFIYVSETESGSDIMLYDVIETETETETYNISNNTLTRDFAPAVSYDGRYIAFSRDSSDRQDVIVYDLELQEYENITEDIQNVLFGLARWNLQENDLVLVGQTDDDSTNLWLSTLVDDEFLLDQLTQTNDYTLPVWSPISSQIAMVSTGTNNLDVWKLDLDTSEYQNLTIQNTDIDTEPVWSYDGTQIAYTAFSEQNDTARQDIWVIDAENDLPRNLTLNTTQAFSPIWSPVDNRIAFVSIDEPISIWVIDVETSNAQNLSNKD